MTELGRGLARFSIDVSAVTRSTIDDFEQEERRADFNQIAEERYARIVAAGKTIPWNEMRGYLEDRLAGRKAKRPSARKLAR